MLDANDTPERIDLEIREKWTVRFYNRLSKKEAQSLRDIPEADLAFISSIPYEAIVTPFMLEKSGYGYRTLADMFNIGHGYCRSIMLR